MGKSGTASRLRIGLCVLLLLTQPGCRLLRASRMERQLVFRVGPGDADGGRPWKVHQFVISSNHSNWAVVLTSNRRYRVLHAGQRVFDCRRAPLVSMSADGSRLISVEQHDEYCVVHDSGGRTRVHRASEDAELSADGRHVLYAAADFSWNWHVYHDGRDLGVFEDAPSPIGPSSWSRAAPRSAGLRLLPDGVTLAGFEYGSDAIRLRIGDREIVSLDVNGPHNCALSQDWKHYVCHGWISGRGTVIFNGAVLATDASVSTPTISADGRRVGFTRDVGNAVVVMVNENALGSYECAWPPVFGPNAADVAYRAKIDGDVRWICRGQVLPWAGFSRWGGFSKSGGTFYFTLRQPSNNPYRPDSREQVILNNSVLGEFASVISLEVDSAGRNALVHAGVENAEELYLNGVLLESCDKVWEYRFEQNGRRFAAWIQKDQEISKISGRVDDFGGK